MINNLNEVIFVLIFLLYICLNLINFLNKNRKNSVVHTSELLCHSARMFLGSWSIFCKSVHPSLSETLVSRFFFGDSSGSRGKGAIQPGPVKISHQKDGYQRRPRRLHVPPSPTTRPLDPHHYLSWNHCIQILFSVTKLTALLMNLTYMSLDAVVDPGFLRWDCQLQRRWGANLLISTIFCRNWLKMENVWTDANPLDPPLYFLCVVLCDSIIESTLLINLKYHHFFLTIYAVFRYRGLIWGCLSAWSQRLKTAHCWREKRWYLI